MSSDNTINRHAVSLQLADGFVYVAGMVLVAVLSYGVKLF